MFLRRVRIENFRGIERLELALDPTTVLIGENDTGKTSLLKALSICLGPGSGESCDFQPTDFRRVGDESEPAPERPIRIRLTFREPSAKAWNLAASPLRKVARKRRGRKEIRLAVSARPGNRGEPHVEWRFLDPGNEPLPSTSDGKLLVALRTASPFLVVRADRGHSESMREISVGSAAATASGEPQDAQQTVLEREIHRTYHDLAEDPESLTPAELGRAMAAVREYAETVGRRLGTREGTRRRFDDVVQIPRRFSPLGPLEALRPGAGISRLAALLTTGAILHARGPRALAAHAEPIVAVENPEAHLHPRLLVSVWGILDAFEAQKIVTTNSGQLMAALPLRSLRRLQRRRDRIQVFQPGRNLTTDEMRRIGYHVRVKRGDALFARCWVLIEGETEFWLIPELARVLGHDFLAEGIRCVEFAQSGLDPLLKFAHNAGIEWHLLTDGDHAGRGYADTARRHLRRDSARQRITKLPARDLEHYLWKNGFHDVYYRAAKVKKSEGPSSTRRVRPRSVIEAAIRRRSKPYLALAIVEEAMRRGPESIPPLLSSLIETAVRLAR